MSMPPIGLHRAILCRHSKTGLGLLALTSAGLLALTGASLLSACFTSAPPAADLILVNGNVITVDADDNIAQAVAVKDGKIVAVGSNQEIGQFVDSVTQRIDLNGLTATPGLLDAHAHFAAGGVDRLYVLDLSYPNVTGITGVVERVAVQVEQADSGEWIQGRGWDEGKFEELRYIYAADLDSVTAHNPVWLTHTMGHYGVANSVALQMADITSDTPDPPGGTIDRYPDGTPTGVLKESAQRLVSRLIPRFTDEQWREGIRQLAKEFNQEGMTGVKEPGIGSRQWDAYRDVLSAGELTVRVFVLWNSGETVEAAEQLIERIQSDTKPYVSTGDDHLISGGVKLYVDGSGGARTAWMHDEWNKDLDDVDEGNYGYPAMDLGVLGEQLRLYHDAGLHISSHAIGDRAIDWVVNSYVAALGARPILGLRHGIIHANIPSDTAIALIADLQQTYDAGYPEPSATFMWWIGDTYAGNFGPERARRLNPLRTFSDKGIRWAGGSDYNVTPFPARYGLWAAIARETLLGVYGSNPYGTDESIDIRTALRSYTIWSARQMFLEKKIGSIEVGKYADIAVWDKDLYGIAASEIKDIQCQLTLFNGKIVYRRPESRIWLEGAG